jgi:hypothetical protein
MRACWEALATKTAAEVSAAENDARQRISDWDEDVEYKTRSLGLLQAMTEQFQKYRVARCELEASAAAAGNGAGDMRLACEVRLNRDYALEIKNLW